MGFYKPTIQQGSYSRIGDYKKCPRLAKYKHIDKIKTPENQAMLRGKELHKQAEEYIQLKDPQVNPPTALWNVVQQMRELAALTDPQTELQMAVTVDWEPCGWFDATVYLRAVVDVLSISGPEALVVDHKTGKIYDGHSEQAKIYGAFILACYPDVQTVKVKFLYIDQGTDADYFYNRSELEALKAPWDEIMATMRADDIFPTNPGRACNWCDFSAKKGGPCEHGL